MLALTVVFAAFDEKIASPLTHGSFISGFLKNRTPHRQPSGPVIGVHFSFHYYPVRVSTRYSFKNGSV